MDIALKSPSIWDTILQTAAQVLTAVGRAIITGRLAGVGTGVGSVVPQYVSLGTSSTATATTAATALTAEVTTAQWAGYARLIGPMTQTTTVYAQDTWSITPAVFVNPTAGATVALYELGVHDALTAGNLFIYATYAVINLPPGSSIQPTVTLQFL